MLKITFSFMMLLFLSSVVHAEIYKWTDDKGNIHYGDKPVTNSKEMDISEEPSQNQAVSKSERDERRKKLLESFDVDRQKKKEKSAENRKNKKQRDAQCGHAKDRLRRYKTASSLYDVDKHGKRTTLSGDVHKKAIKDLQKKIRKYCG